jgi:N-acetylmuramoyl-L-alanine amidase
VTIDPGHGGTDPGNPGMFFPDGLKEAHVTLAVSLLVREELQRLGVNVTMTRTTDTLINLGHRAPRYCRDDCDLFVSIHVNDLPKRGNYTAVRGFETYFQAEARTADAARVAAMENEAIRYEVPDAQEEVQGLAFILRDLQTNEFLRESGRAAELVQAALGGVHDGVDRGVKQANFAVLNTARRPAILVELGFATNREDARLMTTATGQRALAKALADAVVQYLREFDRRSGAAVEGP